MIASNRQQVDMNADQLLRMNTSEPRGGNGTPITALYCEPRIAQHILHQLDHAVGDLLDPEARLPGFEGQTVAGERRCHHGECIRGIATEMGWIGEPRDHLEEFEDRTRPAVQ